MWPGQDSPAWAEDPLPTPGPTAPLSSWLEWGAGLDVCPHGGPRPTPVSATFHVHMGLQNQLGQDEVTLQGCLPSRDWVLLRRRRGVPETEGRGQVPRGRQGELLQALGPQAADRPGVRAGGASLGACRRSRLCRHLGAGPPEAGSDPAGCPGPQPGPGPRRRVTQGQVRPHMRSSRGWMSRALAQGSQVGGSLGSRGSPWVCRRVACAFSERWPWRWTEKGPTPPCRRVRCPWPARWEQPLCPVAEAGVPQLGVQGQQRPTAGPCSQCLVPQQGLAWTASEGRARRWWVPGLPTQLPTLRFLSPTDHCRVGVWLGSISSGGPGGLGSGPVCILESTIEGVVQGGETVVGGAEGSQEGGGCRV